MTGSGMVDISGELIHETDNAILIDDGDRRVWLPKSQVEMEGMAFAGYNIKISIPEWLAQEKELI